MQEDKEIGPYSQNLKRARKTLRDSQDSVQQADKPLTRSTQEAALDIHNLVMPRYPPMDSLGPPMRDLGTAQQKDMYPAINNQKIG